MQEFSTITIGLALLAFLLGAVIVGIAAQSRSRRMQEAHAEQVRHLRDEDRKRLAAIEEANQAKARTEDALAETQRMVEAQTRETEIVRAQFAEEQEAAFGLEDRLNAAEARVLSVEAELAQKRLELQRWNAAYGQLRDSHVRLVDAHHKARTRGDSLAQEMESGRGELGALRTRLDALQTALTAALRMPAALPGEVTSGEVTSGEATPGDETGIVPAQLQEIALAKAEIQSALRQREEELMELRGQLAATRYSLNVLTSSGAQLASQLSAMQTGGAPDNSEETLPAPLPRVLSVNSVEAQREQLANLEGMIADWFVDLRSDIPYSAAMLRAFSGESAAIRYKDAPSEIEGEAQSDESLAAPDVEALAQWLADAEAGSVEDERPVSPDVMLAAIKAASSAALRRSRVRQDELAFALASAQEELQQLQEARDATYALIVEELAEQDALDVEASAEMASLVQDEAEETLAEVNSDLEDGTSVKTPNFTEGSSASTTSEPAAVGATSQAAQSVSARPTIPAGIPRADVPMPSTPRATVPTPTPPGPAAAQATGTPPLRTAWGRFLRRVETVLQRPPGRRS